jgi:hypothetical protein
LSRLRGSNGRTGAKPAISISVYRPETLAQTLECGKMVPVRTSARPLTGHDTSNLITICRLRDEVETANEPLFLEVEEAKRFLLVIAQFQRSGCVDLALRERALRIRVSVLSNTRTSEQVKLMTPRFVVVCSGNRPGPYGSGSSGSHAVVRAAESLCQSLR